MKTKKNTFASNVCKNISPKNGLSKWRVVFVCMAYTVFIMFSSLLGAHTIITSLKSAFFILSKHIRNHPQHLVTGDASQAKNKDFLFFCGFISCPKPSNLEVACLESGEEEKEQINKHLHYLGLGL